MVLSQRSCVVSSPYSRPSSRTLRTVCRRKKMRKRLIISLVGQNNVCTFAAAILTESTFNHSFIIHFIHVLRFS
ncbi:hypothetical protein EVA_09439 [gut metagenome]|uniref:Uncharacterized protein n=1 Tax=gut metagenome TaxID=749906 RepID=J9GK38_9ZZZZ